VGRIIFTAIVVSIMMAVVYFTANTVMQPMVAFGVCGVVILSAIA
jgi:hypothetical protein